jgi:hypothetical protein
MAQFTKTSSDLRPVVNVDVGNNSSAATLNQVVSGATVNLVGPKLQFGTITKGSGSWTAAEVKTIIDTLQQLATVYMYELTTGTPDTLAVATYPAGAWDFSNGGSVDAAITAAVAACTTAATATFTN